MSRLSASSRWPLQTDFSACRGANYHQRA
jgi:hypothetical protein